MKQKIENVLLEKCITMKLSLPKTEQYLGKQCNPTYSEIVAIVNELEETTLHMRAFLNPLKRPYHRAPYLTDSLITSKIIEYGREHEEFSGADLVKDVFPERKDKGNSTIYCRLSDMANKGTLERIGSGLYRIAKVHQ